MPGPDPDPPPTVLEAALRSERAAAAMLFVAVPDVCWVWIIAMARDMYGPMTGLSAGARRPVPALADDGGGVLRLLDAGS